MKLNGNQSSAAETMKSIDNNHLLQIQEIKIDLHKSGEQEKYSEHDVHKVFHVKRVSRQYPPVNRYLVRDAICRKCATASLAIIIGSCYVGNWLRSFFGSETYEQMSLNATPTLLPRCRLFVLCGDKVNKIPSCGVRVSDYSVKRNNSRFSRTSYGRSY